MPLANHILNDYRRNFVQDEVPYDAEEFVEFCANHDYLTDYERLKVSFINKKRSDEMFARAEQERKEEEERRKKREEERVEQARQQEAEAKEQARREYVGAGFSPESFEADWPQIRARLAAEKIAERRGMAASPRDYQSGVPGGFARPAVPPIQR